MIKYFLILALYSFVCFCFLYWFAFGVDAVCWHHVLQTALLHGVDEAQGRKELDIITKACTLCSSIIPKLTLPWILIYLSW